LSQKELESWGSSRWRYRDLSLHRFDTDSECDRRTDKQTDAQAMATTREAFCYRARDDLHWKTGRLAAASLM